VGIRGKCLAIAAGLLGMGATTAGAQDVQIAALAPQAPTLHRCLEAPADEMPVAIVRTCSAALAAGSLHPLDQAVALYRRGRAHQALRQDEEARADLLAAVEHYSANMPVWHPRPRLMLARALAWHALGEVDGALADYDRAARLSPFDARIFLNRGILLAHREGSSRAALLDFERVIALNPERILVERAERESAAILARDPTLGRSFMAHAQR
jgi:tetratricopeptide (TPR) repeat protein